MDFSRESAGAAVTRILSRLTSQTRPPRPRRFRPLAEPMEARAVLSQVSFTHAIVAPAAITSGGLRRNPVPTVPPGIHSMDTVVVDGQIEIQPGD